MPDGYILCATPRCGSTLLCDLLASTHAAGNPDSFFGQRFMAEWAREWSLPAAEAVSGAKFNTAYLGAAIKAGKADTERFGLRLMHEDLAALSAFLDPIFPGLASDKARFETALGTRHFIHLSREDKLAQAISLVKAEQTGLWHIAADGSELERLAPPQKPQYDFKRIKDKRAQLEYHDSAWRSWFNDQGIVPLRLSYESLAADPAAALAACCAALGLQPPDTRDVKPGVARLSDQTNLDWTNHYHADLAASG
ncbi:MAG: Stf0 family sulfotransferase [Albidovulum sp.]